MKKYTLLLLLFSLAAMAQESFPYKRPILMLNKTVTVIRIPGSEQFGYYNFYEDKDCFKTYKEVKVTTPEKELLGRSFTITAIDSSANNARKKYDYTFTLNGDTETLYYEYRPDIGNGHYAFEVKGGLDLPEGFYCDFIEKSEYDYTAKVPEIWLTQSYDHGTTKNETSATFTFFDEFKESGVKSVTLLLENNKTIERVIREMYGSPQSKSYKYQFGLIFNDKEIELLKANKLIGVKLKDKMHTFHPGTGVRLSGILTCLSSLPLIPKH